MLAAFVFSAVVSSLLSPSPVQSFHFFKREHIKIILLYIVVSSTFATPEKLRKFACFLAVAGGVYLIVGLYRIAGYMVKSGSINYDETRYYATIFLFFLPFLLLRNHEAGKTGRIFWKIPLVGSIAGIFILGVRASWIGLAAVLAAWVYFLRDRTRKTLIYTGAGAVAVVLGVATIFFFFPGQYEFVKERMGQKVPVSFRLETWQRFAALSQERILFGHGLDDTGMTERYRAAYRADHGTYPPEDKPTSPHNQFIKIFYQQGVPGLLLFVALLAAFFWRTTTVFLDNRERGYALVGIAVMAAVLGEYVIRCLTEDRSLVPLSLLLGMAGAYLRLGEEDRNRGE
jgi:O-antigen ligase